MKLVTPKYDALNRIVETGVVTDTEDVFATLSESNAAQQIDGETFAILLSSGIKAEVTQTYYDEPLALNTPPTVSLAQENLRNRVATVTFTEDPLNPLSPTEPYDNAVHYSYDIHGNVNRMYTEMGEWGSLGDDMRFKILEYEYDLLSGNVKQVAYQKDKKDQFLHRYTYDGENRIKTVMTSADGQIWDLDGKYFYYDHGPLARVELGENQVQGLDYIYTLQGWLKGINSNTLDPDRDPAHDGLNVIDNANASFARDVYGLTLSYFSGDYKPIDQAGHWNTVADRFEADLTGSNLQTHRHNLYNGNIGAMVNTITDPSDMSPMPIGNAYEYDQLQRLTHARSFTDLNTTTNTWASGQAYDGKYENSFVYDANGNIESQLRKDASGVAIDDLTYRYQDGTYGRSRNRLYHVNDAVNASAFDDDIDDQGTFTAVPSDINSLNNYRYDELGQLTHDAQEEIENITWRNDGKIKSITRVGNSPEKDLTFTYDPMGNRLSKKVFDPSGDILTADYYIRDAQGNVMAVYKLNIDPQTQTTIWTVVERNIYGSDRLGVYAYPDTVYPAQGAPTTDYTSVWRGYRKYELKNHLGNVVTVVSGHKIPVQDGSSIGHFTAQIDAAYDYSPFGVTRMEFGEYRYGFGSHEKIDEVSGSGNTVDMGDRWLDVRLGRTPKTDKRASEYPNLSPYSYAANNPIFYVDRDGERVLIHYQDEQGNNQYYEYGSKQDVPNNQFVQATVNALNEIASSPKVAEKLNFLVQTEDYNININQSSQTITWVGTGGYTDKNGNKVNILRTEQDVEFNPTLGLKETSTGLINAPFINLWHELGHQYNAINNLDEFIQRQENNYEKGSENEKWTREEEMYNIQQNEWPLIEDKGGFKRETHKVGGSSGVEKVKTTGSTSVEEDKK